MSTDRPIFAASKPHLSNRQKKVLEALECGELVQLLAEVDNGTLSPRDLEEALEQYERRHWARRVFAALLGRKVS